MDLPADIRESIQKLESTIRQYENDSSQLPVHDANEMTSFDKSVQEMETKLHAFELALASNRNKIISAKRSLNQFWKYGESVSRFIQSAKQNPAEMAKAEYTPIDARFSETIIEDMERRVEELKHAYENISTNLKLLQSNSTFSLGSLKYAIKSHGESLLNLSACLSALHAQIDQLRDEYRRYLILQRQDHRDPFVPKTLHTFETSPSPQPAAQVQAPALSSFATPRPASTFAFPSATTFLK